MIHYSSDDSVVRKYWGPGANLESPPGLSTPQRCVAMFDDEVFSFYVSPRPSSSSLRLADLEDMESNKENDVPMGSLRPLSSTPRL